MRGKSFIIGVLVLAFVFSFVSAVEFEDFSCENVARNKDLAIGQSLPEKVPFTDEVINIYLSEEIYGNLQVENKTIKDFVCDENENATYKIYVESLDTIGDFLNSEDVLGTYKEKSDSGEIEVKGVGLGNKVKLFFVKIFLKFA